LEAIKLSAAVPSMPQVVARFLEVLQDPDFEYPELARAMSTDPGTVSEMLRLANSALFGVRQRVVSLQHALALLGPKRVRSLLLGRYLVDSMSRKEIDSVDMNYFWRRSLASSVVAARFSDAVLPAFRDEVVISALLADIGIPILAEAFPDSYGPIAARFAPTSRPILPDEELEAVGATHADVSAMVLTHWKLPDIVSGAVNLHQSESPGRTDAASVARLLNGADRIARIFCEVLPPDEIWETASSATAFVGAGMDVLHRWLPSIESDMEELAGVLRIDVIPSRVYSVIARTLQERMNSPAAV